MIRLTVDGDADAGGQAGEPAPSWEPRPWVALLLGVLFPGLGHVHAGALRRAALAFLALWLLIGPAAIALPMLATGLAGLPILGYGAALALLLAVPADGALAAGRARRRGKSGRPRWWMYAGYAALVLGTAQAARAAIPLLPLPYRTFRIPTGSMIPTLLIGDHVLADMRRSAAASIGRGDVVVYEAPDDPGKLYMHRVVGLPGEVIEGRGRIVHIDGRPLDEPYAVFASDLDEDGWRRAREGKDGGPPSTGAAAPERAHRSPRRDFGPYLIPAGGHFVMGDNRENSRDSRAFGLVPREAVRGRAMRIQWSRSRDGYGVRWRRLGRRVDGDG
jgi:signal peptidase I